MADTVEKSQKATKIDVVSFKLNDKNELAGITVNANGTYTTLTFTVNEQKELVSITVSANGNSTTLTAE